MGDCERSACAQLSIGINIYYIYIYIYINIDATAVAAADLLCLPVPSGVGALDTDEADITSGPRAALIDLSSAWQMP